MLLERESPLATLHECLARVRETGNGELVVVAGEAGVGKTSLLRELNDGARGVEWWWGACDNLRTPRPLGPLRDVLDDAAGERHELFDRALAALANARAPVVFAIEDLHWADDATLDFLRYVGRRLDGVAALLVLTHRDDETGPSHPLRAALGDLRPPARVTRIRLGRLSTTAVARLAEGSAFDPYDLHRATGGNPFYVTETIAAGDLVVAPSVGDAVLARAAMLSPPARRALDAAATAPTLAELFLLEALVEDGVAGVDDCVERGLLVEVDGGVAFRHELARLAIHAALPPARRRDLHRRALVALQGRADAARLAHHAAEADDRAALVLHGRQAATEAIAVGAHRAAADHLSDVARHADLLAPEEAATVLELLGAQSYVLGRNVESAEAYRAAIERWRALGETTRSAMVLDRLGAPLVMLGRQAEADAASDEALATLADLPPGPELARATCSAASNQMLARNLPRAIATGIRAIELADAVEAHETRGRARIQTGVAELLHGDVDGGLLRIRDGISIGEQHRLTAVIALGFSQIGSGAGEIRRYDIAVPALHDDLAWCQANDLGVQDLYASAWLARCELALGQWDAAGARATQVIARSAGADVSRCTALVTVGLLRARRGDPAVGQALEEALAIARDTRHLQRLWPVAAARAEAAWLDDRLQSELPLVDEVVDLAVALDYPWALEELRWWQRQAGRQVTIAAPVTPFGLQVAGRFDEAAAAWTMLASPYEAAAARAHGDADAQRAAHASLLELGAGPLARRIAAELRAAGERVPRRANRSTRQNPFALTRREVDVLVLVADGMTNAEIGEALYISAKTVDHHVSSILSKLGVRTRRQAGREAIRLGLTPSRDAEADRQK